MASSSVSKIARSSRVALPRSVHFLGICGRMVGGMALVLKRAGVKVTGTDPLQFAPVPGTLRAAGIRVGKTWKPAHVPKRVQAVVTGAMVRRGNPEFEECLDRGVPVHNTTAFLEEHFLRGCRGIAVVAGTKGKTTTTAMLTWILREAGLDPDWLIGGQVRGGWDPLRLEGSPVKVLEGDEYWCAPGDPVPKFLRYHPRYLAVTNVGYDHLDIFPTEDQYQEAFHRVVDLVPRNGRVVLNADDPGALALRGRTPTPVRLVGFSRKADLRITEFRGAADGSQFLLGGVRFRLGFIGRMNATNAALAAGVAQAMGVPLRKSARALAAFPGVEGRQTVLGRWGDSVFIRDEAFLPIAVKPMVEAIRQSYPKQRLVVLFMPRYTGGREGAHQRELPDCLAPADVVILTSALEMAVLPKPFDHLRLARDLRARGVQAHPIRNLTFFAAKVRRVCRPGDLVLMSLCLGADEYVGGIVEAVRETLGGPPV